MKLRSLAQLATYWCSFKLWWPPLLEALKDNNIIAISNAKLLQLCILLCQQPLPIHLKPISTSSRPYVKVDMDAHLPKKKFSACIEPQMQARLTSRCSSGSGHACSKCNCSFNCSKVIVLLLLSTKEPLLIVLMLISIT